MAAEHVVSAPDASCLPVHVFPGGQGVHTWLSSAPLAPEIVYSQEVAAPSGFVLPAAQSVHTLLGVAFPCNQVTALGAWWDFTYWWGANRWYWYCALGACREKCS